MAPPKFWGLSGRPLSLAVSTIATTGFVLFGYDQGVMSGIITSPAFFRLLPMLDGNSTLQGLVTAIYELGCLAGAIFMLVFGDRVGRRKGIMGGGTVLILGVIIQVTSQYHSMPLAQFIVGRVVTGVGNGMNTATIPTYQAECSKTTNRGLLICIEGGVIAFGTMVAYWIDYGCSFGSDELVWRFPIAFQVVFALVLVIGMIGLPESPRWLISHDRHDEGVQVIAALRGLETSAEEARVEKTLILDSLAASGDTGSYKALTTGGKTQHFRRMLLGVSSQVMQQIGGCNAVIYFAPVLLTQVIADPNNRNLALLLGGVQMIIYAAFATVSWFIIERAGRRKLFLWGTVGQMLSMILVFGCLIPGSDHNPASVGAVVGLFTYIASFGATWLPLPWLYPAEISPIKTRAKANAVSTCSNWIFNFLIVMITPIMIDRIHWGTYLFFAALNACFLPVIYWFYPETRMRSLEEIDIIFAKGYMENISYVKAAQELPRLSETDIQRLSIEYGLVDDRVRIFHEKGGADAIDRDEEKEGIVDASSDKSQ